GVDPRTEPLAYDEVCFGELQVAMEFSARRALDAVVRPQHLPAVIDLDGVVRALLRVIGGEGYVVRWMPVLGQNDVGEFFGNAVDRRHDLLPARHGQRAAGAEIVLDVDHKQDIPVGDLHGWSFLRLLACTASRALPSDRPHLATLWPHQS